MSLHWVHRILRTDAHFPRRTSRQVGGIGPSWPTFQRIRTQSLANTMPSPLYLKFQSVKEASPRSGDKSVKNPDTAKREQKRYIYAKCKELKIVNARDSGG